MIVELMAVIALQASPQQSLRSASAAWSTCAERAAIFVARTDEPADAATQMALDLCPGEGLAVRDALDAIYPDPVRSAKEYEFYQMLSGARTKLRIIFERVCPHGDRACEAFFADSMAMRREP